MATEGGTADGWVVEALRAAGCVFAEEEAAVVVEAAGGDRRELERLVRERAAGRPLEQLVGWAAFAGLRVVVEPGVFVPRRRTELLVREAVADAPDRAVVVDLCCGSGAIGAAIAAYGQGRIRLTTDADGDVAFEVVPQERWPDVRPVRFGVVTTDDDGDVAFEAVSEADHDRGAAGEPGRFEVVAADVDPAAVRCARRNLGAERVFEGDLFQALPEGLRGRVDVLVVNAPYVPTAAIATMPTEARLHEAGAALDGGGDGLDVQRRIVAGAAAWLRDGGRLLIETSERQAPRTAALFEAAGFAPRIVRDEALDATVVVGRR
ncbi:putative protein N(5)-glutamine methyltransferase [Herbiconiux sp. CPCC 205716]|uniref:Methyltransferase small domain-containing protein n=1 Tax=Herbiconiux gentiana TaxID=2970912 RepID=A0ABT2GCW5_9MICO|nr:putative protein N(5)-glutamine methyltransferase [Herbiconiux gentiana]MCS5714027.1 putative protein N(5)-glutamine methyltransferase [Herbiconiux gentiana]